MPAHAHFKNKNPSAESIIKPPTSPAPFLRSSPRFPVNQATFIYLFFPPHCIFAQAIIINFAASFDFFSVFLFSLYLVLRVAHGLIILFAPDRVTQRSGLSPSLYTVKNYDNKFDSNLSILLL